MLGFVIALGFGFLDKETVLKEAAAAIERALEDISRRVEVMEGEEVLRRESLREGRTVSRRAE